MLSENPTKFFSQLESESETAAKLQLSMINVCYHLVLV